MKKIFLTLIILTLSKIALAWPGGSGGTGTAGPGMDTHTGTTTSDNNDLVPVDGGIISITALAIGYGVRQTRKRKEEKNNENGAV